MATAVMANLSNGVVRDKTESFFDDVFAAVSNFVCFLIFIMIRWNT
jgi:hypothetical protein